MASGSLLAEYPSHQPMNDVTQKKWTLSTFFVETPSTTWTHIHHPFAADLNHYQYLNPAHFFYTTVN